MKLSILGKLSKLNSGETLDCVQHGYDPSGVGILLKWNYPLTKIRNKLEHEKYWYKINQYE